MTARRHKKNALEWAVFLAGLALTIGTVSLLCYLWAFEGEREPPSVLVQLGTPEKRDGLFVVPVTVENQGDETAEAVHVQVTLETVAGENETSDFEIQFLPGRGSRHGSVVFKSDPNAGTLVARPLGYRTP